ncbi:putative protein serine/threonine kinase [Heterostelium album PN500]|uniref:non-specific serine/threonine protein kinase n=1 Tax=Heterostelium pallidum (strain ATCC 26659 / Pp 5 / PN500) TaxID=670386 RepID=D3AY23_HETP5|nr:putative protein serine/threonine kinase [Heterostelium album PN500]EFA85850.1 putative protein serine/threonine kinase [Heterostelium album PN500]|eukprot:XP_020437956.1 putative protein serine/threonine kinase [Heterostelium album PN500]
MSNFLQKVLKSPSTQNLLSTQSNSSNNNNNNNNNNSSKIEESSSPTIENTTKAAVIEQSDEAIKQLPSPPSTTTTTSSDSCNTTPTKITLENCSSNSSSPVPLAESNRSDSTTSLSSAVSSNSNNSHNSTLNVNNNNLQRQYSNTSIRSDDSSSLGTMTASTINEDFDENAGHHMLSSSLPASGHLHHHHGSISTPTSPTPFSYTGQQATPPPSLSNSSNSRFSNKKTSNIKDNNLTPSASPSARSPTPLSDTDSPSGTGSSSRLDKFMKKGAQMLRGPDIHLFSSNKSKSSSTSKKKKQPKFDLDTEISAPYSVVHKMHVDFDLKWTGHNDFVLDEKLGDGAYGSVYKGTHKDLGFTLAIKVIEIKESEAQSLQNEINILKNCKSSNIVSYFGSLQNEDKIWILMDFCSLGSIRDIIESTEKTLNESQISFVVKNTLKGLIYLHNQNIIHRDIKAANILLTDQSEVKLADFGVSEKLSDFDDQSKEMIGTPLWMAPEVILKKNYDYKADIWSLGITIIEMADGLPPHMDMNPMRAMKMVPIWSPPTFSEPKKWSPLLNDFLSKCLMKDPEKRLSPKELLNHPFLKKTKGPEVLGDLIHQVLRLKKKKHDEAKKNHENHTDSTSTSAATEKSNETSASSSTDINNHSGGGGDSNEEKKGGLLGTATRGTMVFKGVYSTCNEFDEDEDAEGDGEDDGDGDADDDEEVDPFSTTVFHGERAQNFGEDDDAEDESNNDDDSENDEEYSSTGTMVHKIKKPIPQRANHSRSKSTSAAIALSEILSMKSQIPSSQIRGPGGMPLKPLPPLPPNPTSSSLLHHSGEQTAQLGELIHQEISNFETKVLSYIDNKNRDAVEELKEHVNSVERNLISYVNQELQNVLSVFTLKLQPLLTSIEELKVANQQLLQQQQLQIKPLVTKHSMIIEQPKRCTSPILSTSTSSASTTVVRRPLSSSTASLEEPKSTSTSPTTTVSTSTSTSTPVNLTSSPSQTHSFRPLSAPVIHETSPVQINQRTSAPIPGGRAPIISASTHASSPPKHESVQQQTQSIYNNNNNNNNNINQASRVSPTLRRMSSLPKINSPDTSSTQSPSNEKKAFYQDDHIDINKHLVTEKLKIFQQQQQ